MSNNSNSTTNQPTTSLTKPETFSAAYKNITITTPSSSIKQKVQLSLLFCDLITYDTISVIAMENQDGFENS